MRRIIGICVLILLWELVARKILSPMFPPISQVIPAFGKLLASGELQKHSMISLKEGLSGFLIACALGFSIAVAMSQFRSIETIIQPLIDLMRPVAALTLLPLIILILGIGLRAKVFVIFWTAWPAIVLNTLHGLKTVDQTIDILKQPISDIQLSQLKIDWVPLDEIKPNKYNPNKMTWHDRQLLKQSLLEDGWTQPIVTLPDKTIVDGEQRWTVAGMEMYPKDVQEVIDKMQKHVEQGGQISLSILARLEASKSRLAAAIEAGQRPCLASITGGLVPITLLDLGDDAHKMISTIRHNRARGIHQIDSMAAITKDLVALGLDLDDLETRLGMDDEEIRRFMKSAEGQLMDLQKELDGTDFTQATRFMHIGDLPPETQALLQKSTAAGEVFREHGQLVAERKREVNDLANNLIAEAEAKKKTGLTQDEKSDIIQQAENQVADVGPAPRMPDLVKLVLFILPEENSLLTEITKMVGKQVPEGMIMLTKFAMDNRNQWSEWVEKHNGHSAI